MKNYDVLQSKMLALNFVQIKCFEYDFEKDSPLTQ